MYVPSGVERTLLQWSSDVVKSAVGVENGPSYESLLPNTVWISFFWVLMLHIIRLYTTLMYWGTSCLWMKKRASVPSIYLITWNRNPISFAIELVHFGLSGPFIRCLCYWGFPVYGKMTAFICPGWIEPYPVVLLLCAQSSPVLCIVYAGTDFGGGLCGWNVSTWLAMRLWPFIHLALVLYLCTSGTLHVLQFYWCAIDDLTYV